MVKWPVWDSNTFTRCLAGFRSAAMTAALAFVCLLSVLGVTSWASSSEHIKNLKLRADSLWGLFVYDNIIIWWWYDSTTIIPSCTSDLDKEQYLLVAMVFTFTRLIALVILSLTLPVSSCGFQKGCQSSRHFLLFGLPRQVLVNGTRQSKGIRRGGYTLGPFVGGPGDRHGFNICLDGRFDGVQITLPFVKFQCFLVE